MIGLPLDISEAKVVDPKLRDAVPDAKVSGSWGLGFRV